MTVKVFANYFLFILNKSPPLFFFPDATISLLQFPIEYGSI